MNPLTMPSLPTDNLYKFYAIAGIVISLFSFSFTIIYFTELQDEIIHFQAEIKKAKVETEYLEENGKLLLNKKAKLNNLIDSYKPNKIENQNSINKYTELEKKISLIQTSKDWRDYLEFMYKYENEIFPGMKEFNEFSVLVEEHLENGKNLRFKQIELEKNQELNSKKSINMYFILIFGGLLIFFGFHIAKYGFMKWNKLVQKPNDERLRLELLELTKKFDND